MDLNTIPLVKHLGLEIPQQGQRLDLPFSNAMLNHVGTVHAGAQFTLAETASARHLLGLFPELVDRVVPLLRSATIKYRRPVTGNLHTLPVVEEDAIEGFRSQFDRKGRGLITVTVKLLNEADELVAEAHYDWFVQGLE